MMDLVMDSKTALLLVLFFIAGVHVWATPETDRCSEGMYRNSDGACVSQCPCGYYGDTNSRICAEGTEDMFFNQTRINFKLTVHETLDTPILSAVLYINKSIANKTQFQLTISGPAFLSQSIYYLADDDYFNTPRLRLQANKSNGSRIFECSAGTRTFVMVPFKVYALSVVGSFEIVVYPKRPHLPELGRYSWYPPSVVAKGLVDSGCSGDLKYVSTSRECVESCLCGTYQLLGSCETSSAVSFDSLLKEVYVLPTTKPGSIVANLSLLIDETVLNSSYYMTISREIGSVSHNDSGKITTNPNSIIPLFELTSSAPDLVVSDDNTGRLISHLRMASPVQECVNNSTRYVAVSFGLRLLSDSLYHLGGHFISIRAELKNGTNTINYSRQSLRLIVEAECPDSTQLYDFALHRCVSSCSCGYTPFRSHTTAYCEAVEYRPSNFHDETQTVLVHNSIERVSSSILLYVNLNSQLLRDTQMQPIIGRLSINSTLNQLAEVFFTQPDGTSTLNSTVDIVLNSSLDFSYCYDQLRDMNHTLYSVPIVVIRHNESDPAGPVNHTHTIRLTFHAFREYHSFFSTYTPETLNLFVNKTGTLPVAVTVPVGVIVGVAIITIVVIAVVIAAVLVGIIIYKKRKGKHYNDEEVSCKHISTEDTVTITNASEKIENRKTMDAEELDNMYK